MPDSNAKKLAQFLTSSGTYNLYDVQADSTGFFDLPSGTTAQRPTPTSGMIRYNSTLSLAEYYDGTGWKAIDSPPVVSSISPSNIADSDSSVDITITGSFFASGATVKAIGTDLSEIAASSVTFNSSTELVANFDGTSFSDAQEDYDIEVTNPSGLAGKGNDLLSVNASPVFTTASGSLGTIYDSLRSSYSLSTAAATDDEGASLTYSISVGALPTGLSLNTSTGAITGTASAVGSDTTSTFTVSVTDGANTNTRQFSITVKAPVVQSFTSTGSSTYSVLSGISAVDVLVVAGGGGGGGRAGAGGGAGGLIYRPAFPVTPGGSVSLSVGSGGSGGPGPGGIGNNGQDSTFGTLTAKGGGGGGDAGGDGPNPGGSSAGQPGGSGGGHGYGQNNTPTGTGTQPSQPGESGSYGFGNPGGFGSGHPQGGGGAGGDYNPGGGGGAGASGGQGDAGQAGPGGAGRQYGISGSQIYYAGGGGGGSHAPHGQTATGGQGGGGNGALGPGQNNGGQGNANRGGGAGGGCTDSGGGGAGGTGGSGIVIVSY